MRRVRFLLLSLLLLALVMPSSLLAQSLEELQQAPLPGDPQVRVGRLPNGMTYYIRANQEPKERAEFYIVHHVGAILETKDQEGLAHFTEHMAFQGTKHFPGKALIGFLEHNGVKFGADLNASTSYDMTIYNISDVPTTRPGLLDSCLLVLCDWSGDITMEDAEIDSERGVIVEEKRTRGNAQWRLTETLLANLFKGSKYATHSVIGEYDFLKTFPHQAIREFYHKWYRPEYQALVIVGDFDAAAMEARVKTMAGALPKRPDHLEKPVIPVPPTEAVNYVVHTDKELPMTMLQLHIKHQGDTSKVRTVGDFQRDLYREMVLSMLNARYAELVEQGKAPFVQAQVGYGPIFGGVDIFSAICLPKPTTIKESYQGMLRELFRAKQHGFTATEIARTKAEFDRAAQKEFDERAKTSNAVHVRACVDNFLRHEPLLAPEVNMQLTKMLSGTLTPELSKQVLAEMLEGQAPVILLSANESMKDQLPSDGAALYTAAQGEVLLAWVDSFKAEPLVGDLPTGAKVVKEKKNKRFDAIDLTLSNGIKVILKPTDFKDDQVRLYGEAEGGYSLASDADLYSAQLASTLQSRSGLGAFDATALTKALAGKQVGASVDFHNYSSSVDGFSSAKLDEIETMFQLVYLLFTQPRFDSVAYTSTMALMRTVLQNQEENPDYIFFRHYQKELTSGHPRARQLSLADVDKVDLQRAADFYRARMANGQNFVFVLVGKFEPDAVKPIIARYLGNLPKGKRESWQDHGVRFPEKGVSLDFGQKMENPKCRVGITWHGETKLKRVDEIYASMLGAINTLRCTEDVREKQGGTYGVYSTVNTYRRPTSHVEAEFLFDTDPEKVNDLLPIIDNIFLDMQQQIQASALEKVKKNMLKEHAQELRSNGYWADVISSYELTGVDYVEDYEKQVESVQVDDLYKAARRFFGGATKVQVQMSGYKE